MHGISKRFGAVQALEGVGLELIRGEIHALLGENGAGKTTLMNLLSGLIPVDEGEIWVDRRRVQIRDAQEATRLGIGMVHQHFMLVPTLTAAENLLLGQPGRAAVRRRDVVEVSRSIRELGSRYGLEVDPGARIWQLSVGEQQRVEILRALHRQASVLILDEPTASLTPIESDRLFPKLRALAEAGTTIVFITHHLEEVLGWADRITVLRQGRRVGALHPHETSVDELARMMVGRSVSAGIAAGAQRAAGDGGAVPGGASDAPDGQAGLEPVLGVSDLWVRGDRGTDALRGVSFEVAPGEILAVAGVEGNG
ncbi:MAG: ATP-binding cassette domain-containing protein, partial [Solirubrobacterales bacterium]